MGDLNAPSLVALADIATLALDLSHALDVSGALNDIPDYDLRRSCFDHQWNLQKALDRLAEVLPSVPPSGVGPALPLAVLLNTALPVATADGLEALASQMHRTPAEELNYAASFWIFAQQALQAGSTITLRDKQGNTGPIDLAGRPAPEVTVP